MRQYSRIAALLFGIFLALFLLVEAIDITHLKEPSFWLEHAGVLAGFAGVCLLVADVALPVPSSLVMIAHGALFGVVIGTLLSLVGSTDAALAGFAIGRRSGPLLARLVPVEELVQADCLLIRWGMLAIIVTPLSAQRYMSNRTSNSIRRSPSTSTLVVTCTSPASPSDVTPIR